jgi:hypothetical protein
MDGTSPQASTITVGSIYSIFSLVVLILALGFVGALLWLMLE